MHSSSPLLSAQIRIQSDTTFPASATTTSSRSLEKQYARRSNVSIVPLPPDLEDYLVTTSRPSENFLALRDSRERRLRLLLRRFTNQIQYGCRNPFCTVPTCLSYRKRHSTVPVRLYTDVAARTLAWQCVEDYIGSSKHPSTNSTPTYSNKSKSKSSIPQNVTRNPLCWNEPVIPWYEDPVRHLQRKRLSEGRVSQSRQNVLPAHAHPSQSSDDSTSDSKQLCMDKTVNKSQLNGTATVGGEKSPMCKESQINKHKGSSKKLDVAANGHVPPPLRSVRFDIQYPDAELVSDQPKDTASFSQSLHDTGPIKTLDKLVSTNVSATDTTNPNTDTHQAWLDNDGEKHATRTRQGTTPGPSIYTFKLLNQKILSWLANLIAQPSPSWVIADRGQSTSIAITELAQQTIHYNLSHPLRLLESAEQWAYSQDENDRVSASISTGHWQVSDCAQECHHGKECNATQSDLHQIPTQKGAMHAFRLLSRMQSPQMLAHCMFTALQCAYILPSFLRKTEPSLNNSLAEVSYGNTHRFNDSISQMGVDSIYSDYLDDQQVASMCAITLLFISHCKEESHTVLEPRLNGDILDSTYDNYFHCRRTGQVFPHAYVFELFDKNEDLNWRMKYRAVLERIDAIDDTPFIKLLECFSDVVSHRLALQKITKAVRGSAARSPKGTTVVDLLVDHVHALSFRAASKNQDTAYILLEMMCVILLKKWDKNPTIKRTGSVGGALEVLAGLYRNRIKLGIPAADFVFRFMADAFDTVQMPLDWLKFRENSTTIHVLSFSFLFEASNLVKYFRAMNIEIMRRAHEYASTQCSNARHFLVSPRIPVHGTKELLADLRPHMVRYFVLTIRRDHILEDAIDQIWRRQRQELMRPLKVSLGKGEGEDGLDHGGVQQEFFRVVFAAALNIDYGMFTVDERTRMTWFQPSSLEPLYKFEALGILMSLAVYNAVTLPITFPLAFYRKLLGLKVKQLEHIEDGWPDLTRGLKTLRDWSEGDVGDVMARTYEFSYQVFGQDVHVDMSRTGRDAAWPPSGRRKSKDATRTTTFENSPRRSTSQSGKHSFMSADSTLPATSHWASSDESEKQSLSDIAKIGKGTNNLTDSNAVAYDEEAPLVTNENRAQYIKDYIFWLTNKSISPQFEAFSKGFYACLDRTALSIFTPDTLKLVVEGYADIDIEGLQATAIYEDFSASEQIILDFWDIVKGMSPEQHKHFLEFVTASDRVPVNGITSVTFIIQRNGEDNDRLPSSSTCYGRLLLPHYSSKDILKEKLEKAIENSVGFGSL